MPNESALVVLIPEAERLVEIFRKRFDPSAAVGVPAHVTILYPFKCAEEITNDITTTLRELFLQLPGFTTSFSTIQQFPDALFLAPEPAEPFRQLTEAVFKAFPDRPPYGGAFKEIVPHLTIAQVNDIEKMNEIASEFQAAAKGRLPIHARVEAVTLMENSSEQWQTRVRFSLRSAKQAG